MSKDQGKKGLISKIFRNKGSPTLVRSSQSTKRAPPRDQSAPSLVNSSRRGSLHSSNNENSRHYSNYLDDDNTTIFNHADQSVDDFGDHSSRSNSHSSYSMEYGRFDLPSGAEGEPFPSIEDSQDKDSPCAGITNDSLIFPKPIKLHKRSNKSPRLFNNLFLAQELRCGFGESIEAPYTASDESLDDTDAEDSRANSEDELLRSNELLVMEWSRDGKHLAVAGRDAKIYVWQVISSPLSRLKYRNFQATSTNSSALENSSKLSYPHAPVFLQEPVRVFEGHTKTILSLDWSKNNFLISGSMDRTAKLWNVERADCLQTFKHDDFVTAVKFHPTDDRFFLSGSLDNRVRLWSILDASVAYIKDLGEGVLITALAFTPAGNFAIVGSFNGSLFCFETKGLHFRNRVEIKERKNPFHHKNDNRITGIKVFDNERATDIPYSHLERYNLLITTNDSKVRLIDIKLTKLVTRFKGASNTSSSIVASISDDNRFIICGSEDHWCYVWENTNSIINNRIRKALSERFSDCKQQAAEHHKKLDKLLQDVRLWKKFSVQRFMSDSQGTNIIANENNSYSSFHAHHTKVNAAVFAPAATHRLLEYSDDIIYDLVKRYLQLNEEGILDSRRKDLDYAKSTGMDCGHIVATCDQSGTIKVFRQDSAVILRKALVDYSKKRKDLCTPELSRANSMNKNNLRLDLNGLHSKGMRHRVLNYSTMERSPSFKTMVLNRFRSPTRQAHSPSPATSPGLVPTSSHNQRNGAPNLDPKAPVVYTSSEMTQRNVPRSTALKPDYMTLPLYDDHDGSHPLDDHNDRRSTEEMQMANGDSSFSSGHDSLRIGRPRKSSTGFDNRSFLREQPSIDTVLPQETLAIKH